MASPKTAWYILAAAQIICGPTYCTVGRPSSIALRTDAFTSMAVRTDATVPASWDGTVRSVHKPDALDLLEQEASTLRELFARWDATRPAANPKDLLVDINYERGTVGKLLLEHAAVYLAACRDVAARSGSRTDSVTRQIEDSCQTAPILDELDEMARGVDAVSLVTPAYSAAIERLRAVLVQRDSPVGDTEAISRLRDAMQSRRRGLHSANFVAKHAPTHPGRSRWYAHIPGVIRAQALYDRLRGDPWAESTNWGDAKLAQKYQRRK